MQKLIDKIYQYQIDKNELIEEITGLNLIPEKFRLTKQELAIKGFVDYLKESFIEDNQESSYSRLYAGNCLNCLYDEFLIKNNLATHECSICKYSLNGQACELGKSLYRRVRLKFTDKNGEFKKLTMNLKKELDK